MLDQREVVLNRGRGILSKRGMSGLNSHLYSRLKPDRNTVLIHNDLLNKSPRQVIIIMIQRIGTIAL